MKLEIDKLVSEYVVCGSALYSFYSVYCNDPHYKSVVSDLCASCKPLFCDSKYVDPSIAASCSNELQGGGV